MGLSDYIGAVLLTVGFVFLATFGLAWYFRLGDIRAPWKNQIIFVAIAIVLYALCRIMNW